MCTLHSATNQPGLPTHFCNAPNLASATIHRGQPFMPYVQNPGAHQGEVGVCGAFSFQWRLPLYTFPTHRAGAFSENHRSSTNDQRRWHATTTRDRYCVIPRRPRAPPCLAERRGEAPRCGDCANARCPTDAGGGGETAAHHIHPIHVLHQRSSRRHRPSAFQSLLRAGQPCMVATRGGHPLVATLNVAELRRQVADGVNIDELDEHGLTALLWATLNDLVGSWAND